MCDFCEKLKTTGSVNMGTAVYPRRPYPVGEIALMLHMDATNNQGIYHVATSVTAFHDTRRLSERRSAEANAKVQIYYCPFCGEKL